METNNTIVDSYFGLLRHLDPEMKRELIKKLSDSITTTPSSEDELDSLCGAWEGEETAEELIKLIRESRTFDRKIEPL
ncbi:MAG: hypothetical protein AAB209_03650 [Bacteroidota bacterium]